MQFGDSVDYKVRISFDKLGSDSTKLYRCRMIVFMIGIRYIEVLESD